MQVLEFVDEHGNEVLNLGSFTLLPQHVVRLILSREDLRADEFTKFQVSAVVPLVSKHGGKSETRLKHFEDYFETHPRMLWKEFRDVSK